jgi:DHA3 family macrolide efflux protein-like MFS transporter
MATQFSVDDHIQWKAPFLTVWSGQAISITGSQLVQFALIWYLTIETGSATVLATASLIGLLPNVILGPFVGTLVDRGNRRAIMLMADSIITLATVMLAVLFAGSVVSIWHVYVAMFIRALAGSFHRNAMSASTSLMVPREHLTRIQGMNQMLNGGLNIIAAPLGAFLLGLLPMQGILAIDVTTALFAIMPLLLIQIPEPERTTDDDTDKDTIWQDFKAGLRYVLAWRGLLIVSLMTIGINFTIIPAFSLLPLLVKEYFGGNAVHLGWVESAMGIGMILGGATLGVWGGFGRNIMTSLFGLAGMGIGTLILAVAPSSTIAFAIGGSLFVGMMTPITMGPFYAMIQSVVAPDMQARIFSLLSSAGSAMVPIGLIFAGPIADLASIQAWFLFGGSSCVVMAVLGIIIPAVRNIEGQGERVEHLAIASTT